MYFHTSSADSLTTTSTLNETNQEESVSHTSDWSPVGFECIISLGQANALPLVLLDLVTLNFSLTYNCAEHHVLVQKLNDYDINNKLVT